MPPNRAFAPAKVNLTLHVTGQRADGYHVLDSLVAFADCGDQVLLAEGSEMSVEVSGPFAAGVPTDARNLVWRAAEASGWTGHISVEKNLPHGAGIGGGSSDAGAVLRALNSSADPLALGADVPVCKLASAARMSGIGDVVTPVPQMPPLSAILVNPGVHVPTPKVFSGLVSKTNAPMETLPAAGASTVAWLDWLAAQRNDLEPPAKEIAPTIGQVLNELAALDGTLLARMSGSGATCFALMDSECSADVLARDFGRVFPDWWVKVVTLA